MTQPRLMLASGSPRRLKLLKAAGFDVEVVAPQVGERADTHLTARELTAWNAVKKGVTIARRYPTRVVVAADTVVCLRRKVIGKPADFPEAVRILRQLSGRTHQVYSSVFITHLAVAKANLFCEVSHVRFKNLDTGQIREYLARINPLDKAGAYAAQGHGAEIIDRIEGSYSNVVGLPMEQTTTVLSEFGIRPIRQPN